MNPTHLFNRVEWQQLRMKIVVKFVVCKGIAAVISYYIFQPATIIKKAIFLQIKEQINSMPSVLVSTKVIL